MRNRRPASRPITNPFATTPSSLVTSRKCSSPGPSQGAHMTSRSTLDLRTLGSAICAYSVEESVRTTECRVTPLMLPEGGGAYQRIALDPDLPGVRHARSLH